MSDEQKLAKLIQENPTLPVLPLVYNDFILDFENEYEVAKIRIPFISEYCTYEDEEEKNMSRKI